MNKSIIAGFLALGPCSILLPAACGGTDYVDSPDAATSDATLGPDVRDGAQTGDGDPPQDGSVGDEKDSGIDAGDAGDASDAMADADASNVPLLRTAKSFAVLGGQTVTNSGVGTTIVGDLGVSPGNTATGLPPGQPVGATHLGDPVALQAQLDLTTLYDDLAGRPCLPANVLTGEDLAGKTLLPGVYCFASSAALGVGTLTLDADNDPNAFWVFQIASTLDVAMSTVTVIKGGTPCNIFWQVGSSATLLDNAAFAGNIVAFSSIDLNTGALVSPGRALARNAAVTMLSNQVSKALCL